MSSIGTGINVFVARQAIFDREERVVGYELLFRSGTENVYSHDDGDEATARLIDHGMLGVGMDYLTRGKRTFFNCSRRALTDQLFALLPKDKVVMEIVDPVDDDPELVDACQRLKDEGFTLAFNVNAASPSGTLFDLADVIKVDFTQANDAGRRKAVARYGPIGVELVAEKVESRADYRQALELGFHAFQGFFFCEPEVVVGKDIPHTKANSLQFIQEVNRPEIDFGCLERVVKQDMSLSVKLLRYLNSAEFCLPHEIRSVKQAIMLLGERKIRRWASLVALAGIGADKPPELVVLSLIRARFCELLGLRAGVGDDLELFLLGLLSLLDALLDRPRERVMSELVVPETVQDSLMGLGTAISPIFSMVVAYERGEWARVSSLGDSLGLYADVIPRLYGESVRWADETYRI